MRIKIVFPSSFIFTTNIPVRISDINYGGHVGNDRILSIMHEARLQFLNQWAYTEMDAGGVGLIMADSAIQYKGEAFYGDDLRVEIAIANMSSISFDIFYKISTERNKQEQPIAFAKTGMICFDYKERKMVEMSEALKDKLSIS